MARDSLKQKDNGDGSSQSAVKAEAKPKKPRGRAASRPFPHQTFEEALTLAIAIQRTAGSNPVRRLTLFNELGKSPESGPSRQLVISAGRYQLVKGGVQSETLQLTPEGDLATSEEATSRERARARMTLAVETTEVFKSLFGRFSGQKLPSTAVLEDAAVEFGMGADTKTECIELFISNLKFVGLIQTLSGAERILTMDHALDSLPSGSILPASSRGGTPSEQPVVVHSSAQFDRTCFFLSPIGEDGSEERKHSDMVLEQLIRPAIEQFGLEVKRADDIQKSGIITGQIFEYLLKSRMAIADLSFHNPNVFYELAIRHAKRLPVIQIIRRSDKIPFDISPVRTIVLDTTDLYSFVPHIESYRLSISQHVRSALEDPVSVDNPYAAYAVTE